MRSVKQIAIILLLSLTPLSVSAISPEEQLSNPLLEERARDLSKNLRCLVCQNQSIDDSDAELAVDLRREVRSLIKQGQTDDEILNRLRERYGDYILLKPPVSSSTYLLWLAPIFIILGGLFFLWRWRQASDEEAAPTVKDDKIDKDDLKGQTHISTDDDEQLSFSQKPLIIAILCLLLISLGGYMMLGRPDIDATPLADRAIERQKAQQTAKANQDKARQALEEAEAAAKANPDALEPQLILAMQAARQSRFDIEQSALQRAREISNDAPEVLSMLAEAFTREAEGTVTLPARKLIANVLSVNPDDPRALYLAGLAAYQDQEFALAIESWQAVLEVTSPDAPFQQIVIENIKRAAKEGGLELPNESALSGPSQDDIAMAADMSPEERQEMITEMVASLAEKLQDNPNDFAGWQRLARAYEVLGNEAEQIRALIGAANAHPSDEASQLAALEIIFTTDQGRQWLNEARQMTARLAQADNRRPETLLFQIYFARLANDSEQERRALEILLEELPQDAPQRPNIEADIQKLREAN